MDFNIIFSPAYVLSLVFYLSVFSSAALLAHLSIAKKRRIYAVFAVLIPAAVGGLRYMVGVDYASYVEKLQLLSDRGIDGYFTTGLLNIFEPTMYLMAHTTFATDSQAIGFFTVTSGLIALFYYLASRRYSPKYTGLMFFTLIMTVFPRDFNGVRQGVAVAITFYAVSFILERRKLPFVLLVLLASLFHYSAIIMLAAYPLYWLLYKKWPLIKDVYYVTKIASLVGLGYAGIFLLTKNLSAIPFLGRYAYLLSPEKMAAVGSPNILTKLAPVLLVAPFYPKMVKNDKHNAYFMSMSVFAVLFTTIGLFAGFLYRIANYFIPFYAILFVNVIDTFEDKKKQRLVVAAIILYSVAHFIGSNMIRNSYDIFPYQFIFTQWIF